MSPLAESHDNRNPVTFFVRQQQIKTLRVQVYVPGNGIACLNQLLELRHATKFIYSSGSNAFDCYPINEHGKQQWKSVVVTMFVSPLDILFRNQRNPEIQLLVF